MFRAGLCLKDGKCWEGSGFGASSMVLGEVCFTTAMTGYVEALTDPSYCNQILIFTTPLIGNYGVSSKDFQSDCIQVKGVIAAWVSPNAHHPSSECTFTQWITEQHVFGLCDVDTRSMVLYLREHGTMAGVLYKIETIPRIFPRAGSSDPRVVGKVSTKEAYRIQAAQGASKTILVVDCGVKRSILDALTKRGFNLLVVPFDADIAKFAYDGVCFSNGPGDPNDVPETIAQAAWALNQNKPILGICLGHQILALAAGASVSKLKFGHRGVNQPVVDVTTNKGYITSHNHGFTVDYVPDGWRTWFRHMHDQTIEGMFHESKPFLATQFHPEGKPGPTDCEALVFDDFTKLVCSEACDDPPFAFVPTPKHIRKVCLLGSGGLTIGQAGEFDYSGAQAIKALKQENIHVVLVNPNIASVQTSMADTTYYYPVTPEYVDKIIDKEKVDGVMVQFGGQTALNCGLGLTSNVSILGTSKESITAAEDRAIFAQRMREIGEMCAPSVTVSSYDEALRADLGYPVLIRTNFSLGGAGSGFAYDAKDLERFFSSEAESQTLTMDKSLFGHKEIEVEVLHDVYGNAVVVAICENVDPTGIHTADSVVVAPAQTLTNDEYFGIRDAALRIVRHLNIIGECNVQFALCPQTSQRYVIEVNPRLSRSSALVSKVTGISLAYLAAKLCLGHSLLSLTNDVTKTTAFFEPAMDYCVVKVPRWDMAKFAGADAALGSSMKSIGEGLGVGRTFREAFDSALRSTCGTYKAFDDMQTCGIASVRARYAIDAWFLERFAEASTPRLRHMVSKHIDTCAGEFPCFTNYLYLTAYGSENERVADGNDIVILGSGPYRIGSSCEFDWSAVQAMRLLKRLRRGPVVMVNNNSATVSTDYSEADVLYLTEVCVENVKSIAHKEAKIVVCVGGQTANNLAQELASLGWNLLGSSASSIHTCEDRSEFGKLLDALCVSQPPWASVDSKSQLTEFAQRYSYPLLLRPSYVLSGTSMRVIYTQSEIPDDLKTCTVTKFVQDAKEIECDAVADNGKMIACVASEKIELAGTHSGDSSLILPPQRLYVATLKQVHAITALLAKALRITGPFNVQYLSKDNNVQVIECNLRASRSLPFVCKTYRVNFMDLAIRAMLGLEPTPAVTDPMSTRHVCVKVPMFSFHRLADADPVHSIEMVSTGEVAAFGRDVFGAFRLAMEASGFHFPSKNAKVFVHAKETRDLKFPIGLHLFATRNLSIGAKCITKHEALNLVADMDLVICIPSIPSIPNGKTKRGFGYTIRRRCVDLRVPLVTNAKVARMVLGVVTRPQGAIDVVAYEDHWK